MARRDPMIHLRVSEELKDSLEREAKANGRSLNSEVVTRIESSFNPSLVEPGKTEIDINKALVLAQAILSEDERRRSGYDENEAHMINFWRNLSPRNQKLLLSLFTSKLLTDED